ncbi:chaplin family protein [Phytohabitans sp. ZYX-F-186]|uniref:Chaplin family protein n=1 Tax=Phytohabitans maris TaxID=3071409 RepID=A0ABU0ZKT1_9ACTN|nr:chaplin family protein [Phytohabitans sp. ZYX-F-186]MDQ7906999.1 chaplin family protein [Phytohabitans sp. ZYX-F-186]
MKTWVRKTLSVGVLAAGALLFAPSAVHADTAQVSLDNDGILNGNQAYAPIQIPVNVAGNGVGVLGVGAGISGLASNGAAQDVDHWSKSSRKHKEASRTEDTTQFSWGNDGIANGNQAYVPIQIPVNVAGNGVGVLGVGAGISGIAANGAAQDVDKESKRTEDTAQVSGDNDGILNGNQVYVPVQVPINICGNGVGVLGLGVGVSGACVNGAAHDVDKESKRTEDTAQVSSDNDGILNGNQIYVPVQVPINICGNGVGVLGVGAGLSGACFNGAAQDVDKESKRTEDTAQVSGDNDGILNGNQVYVPVQVPINACGNGVGVLGVGVGVSGACVNGAAQDVDGKPGDGGDDGYYKKSAKSKSVKKEALPLVGGLTGTLTSGLPTAGGASSLPVAGDLGSGVKTSKVNVAGVDPMGLLSQVPA